MAGREATKRTRAREAYFLELANELVTASPLPLMLTGGITRWQTAEAVLACGVALIGMGTALAFSPELPHQWREDPEEDTQPRRVTWTDKNLASAASMALVRRPPDTPHRPRTTPDT